MSFRKLIRFDTGLSAVNATIGSIVTTGGNTGIGTTSPSSRLQINAPVDNIYSNIDSGAVRIFGTAFTSGHSGTMVINSTNSFARNVGASLALGGRMYNFGGGNQHATFAKISGVQANTQDAYYGDFVIEVQNSGLLVERLRINQDGNVGIGTTSPSTTLTVNSGNVTNGNLLLAHNSLGGVIIFNDETHSIWGRIGRSGAIDRMEFHEYGDILFWTGGSLTNQKLRFAVPDEDKVSFYFQQDNIAWHTDLYNDGDAYGFAFNYFAGPTNTGGYTGHGVKGFIDPFWNNSRMNFTGQHRSNFKDLDVSDINKYVGLIVRSTGKYFSMNNEEMLSVGKEAISINESLPIVELTTTHKDKAVFGVVSNAEDPNKPRTDKFGCWGTPYRKQLGDNRVFVNGLGEGALWVSNKNGVLVNGDYITTSTIPGYGERQLEEYIANYTVAKITMGCYFNPNLQPKMQPQKDILGDNVLDTKGNIIWEETGEYEYEYDIRYIDEDGNILTSEDYDSNIHFISAFVGCTYHCS